MNLSKAICVVFVAALPATTMGFRPTNTNGRTPLTKTDYVSKDIEHMTPETLDTIESYRIALGDAKSDEEDLLTTYQNALEETPPSDQHLIERNIGSMTIPVGITQPLLLHDVNGKKSKKVSIPIATTEATLVASTRRGVGVINRSGGIHVYNEPDAHVVFGITIETKNIGCMAALRETLEAELNAAELQDKIVSKTSNYCELRKIEILPLGNRVRLLMWYATGDAAGQNMMTKASAAIMGFLDSKYTKNERYGITHIRRSNLDGDKKPSQFTATRPTSRGVQVTAQVLLCRKAIRRILHVSPEDLLHLHKQACTEASAMGENGNLVNPANLLAATFLSLGQDPACIVECSQNIVAEFELTPEGDVLGTWTFPNLLVGNVGGFTNTMISRAALNLVEADSKHDIAKVIASAVVAQDISILGSLATHKSGDFTTAHSTMGGRAK